MSSLTSLLSPMISQNVQKSVKDSNLISNFLFVNSFRASLFLIISVLFVYTYNYFFDVKALVGYNPDRVILLSILACIISSLYYPKLWHVKFSNLETKLLKLIGLIFLITLILFGALTESSDLFVFYIIFEVLIYLVSFILYRTEFPTFKNKLSPSLYASLLIVFLYLTNFGYLFFQLIIYSIFILKDFKEVRSILDSKTLDQ